MLATRRSDPELNFIPWSFNKLETAPYARKLSSNPRMSNTGFETPLSTATEWQGHYSFLPPTEPIFATPTYDHLRENASSNANSGGNGTSISNSSNTTNTTTTGPPQPASTNGEGSSSASSLDHFSLKVETSSPLGLHNRSIIDPLGLRKQGQSPQHQHQHQPPTPRLPKPSTPTAGGDVDTHGADVYGQRGGDSVVGSVVHDDGDIGGLGLVSSSLSSVLHMPDMTASGSPVHRNGTGEGHAGTKDDDDDLMDDDDLGGDEPEALPRAQTAAERTALRRKMKRFRLTHQQTRFLMSEFAKQPHPDAAHRERLSREIPGLSPRQVQVWFQNRRAKIKRLAADDRERMIKMRAVPDDFDNVQALHSPYGAVHGLGTPMASPVDFGGASSYTDHIMRPLMVDVRRPNGSDDTADHLSPTGLSPAFGSIGFNPGASDILSPLSPTSTGDQLYAYSNHLVAAGVVTTSASTGSIALSPLDAGPRMSTPYTRQNSLDGTSGGATTAGPGHHRHPIRPLQPLQPLQLREAMLRSRPDNLQSPLRSSMSWKGGALDYSTYPGSTGVGHHGSTSSTSSPPLATVGRTSQTSLYSSDGLSGTPTTLGFESHYSDSTVPSPTPMVYPDWPAQASQASQVPTSQNDSSSSRLRTASVTLPLSLDLRVIGAGNSGSGNNSNGPLSVSATSPYRHNSLSSYLTSYPTSYPTSGSLTAPMTAPLTTPLGFGVLRTSTYRAATTNNTAITTSASDFSQLSAPLAPPHDFSQAFQTSLAGTTTVPPATTINPTAIIPPSFDLGDDGKVSHELKRKHSFALSSGNGYP